MPFAELTNSAIGAAAHLATAREMAAKGTVLLKNQGVSGSQLWGAGKRAVLHGCALGLAAQGHCAAETWRG